MGQVPLPTKYYGRPEEVAFSPRIQDYSADSSHGDIGVDPYTTEAHTAVLMHAAAAGVNVDIMNLYNHYPIEQ
jgi:hypothetical protein